MKNILKMSSNMSSSHQFRENWECRECPECEAHNWYKGQNAYEITSDAIEVVYCWKCKRLFWVEDTYTETDGAILEFANKTFGCPDPSIPTNMLQLLVDAAKEQYDELTFKLRSSGEHEYVERLVNDLRLAINHVKTIIADKDTIKSTS